MNKNSRFMRTVVAMLCVLMLGFCACAEVVAKEKGVQTDATLNAMTTDKLRYFPSNRYWTDNGTKLVVEGGFYNLSGDYDVISLDDSPCIYVDDLEGNTVAVVKIKKKSVGVIPHGGFYPYNFTVSTIPGGANTYRATELIPILEASFTYADHFSENCPYCGNSSQLDGFTNREAGYPANSGTGTLDTTEYPCYYCLGKGYLTCSVCRGSGKNELYDYLGPIMKALEKKYCENCNGTGKIVCGVCNGTGKSK